MILSRLFKSAAFLLMVPMVAAAQTTEEDGTAAEAAASTPDHNCGISEARVSYPNGAVQIVNTMDGDSSDHLESLGYRPEIGSGDLILGLQIREETQWTWFGPVAGSITRAMVIYKHNGLIIDQADGKFVSGSGNFDPTSAVLALKQACAD